MMCSRVVMHREDRDGTSCDSLSSGDEWTVLLSGRVSDLSMDHDE